MGAALVAVLILHPVLADSGPLRLLAVGTAQDPVEWSVDGRVVANTTDGSPASVHVSAGEHTIVARSAHTQAWSALVRSEPRTGGLQAVPAWTAHWDAAPTASGSGEGPLFTPMGAGAAGAASLLGVLGWKGVRWRRRREPVPTAQQEADGEPGR